MLRKSMAVLGVAAVTAGSAAAAGAATTHATKHKVKVTAHLKAAQKTPKGVLSYTGTTSGTGGKGTVVTKDKIKSATMSISTSTVTYKTGTITSVFNVVQTISTTGVTFKGTGKVIKGTGIYKHAKGTEKLTGQAPLSLKTAVITVTGTLVY